MASAGEVCVHVQQPFRSGLACRGRKSNEVSKEARTHGDDKASTTKRHLQFRSHPLFVLVCTHGQFDDFPMHIWTVRTGEVRPSGRKVGTDFLS